MMIIGRLRPDRKTKYKTKSGRPRALAKSAIGSSSDPFSQQAQRSASLLEQLPVELLQDIFLYSANLHLPLCSKQILSALTSKHLQLEISLQILVYQAHKLAEDERSLLLSRRFFTWPFVVRYVQIVHSAVTPTVKPERSRQSSTDDEESSDDDSREVFVPTPPDLRDVDRRLSKLVRNAMDELRRNEVSHFVPEVNTDSNPALDELCQIPALENIQALALPEKVLHGGWDDDRLRLLRLLLLCGCRISKMSYVGAVAEEGCLEAIEQASEEVVHCFLGVQINVQPTVEMLRKAMEGTNVRIVFQLIRVGQDQLDRLDPQVWKLLEGHLRWDKETKDTIRGWLQNGIPGPMTETHAQYLPRLRDIDVDGTRWVSVEGKGSHERKKE